MKIPKKVVETVEATTIQIHAKICDSGSYILKNGDKELAAIDDYVPSFFPGDHYGDYLILDIEIETGKILNWKKPNPEVVAEAFKLIEKEED